MTREEMKYTLIGCKEEPKFYAENEERKKIFLELLNEQYPYAIKVFIEAPERFIEEWVAYKDKNFKLIAPLYELDSTETQKKDYYCKHFSKLSDNGSVLSCLKIKFWEKSTVELLNFYKKVHKKESSIKPELKEFHKICIQKIDEISKNMENKQWEAIVYFKKKELEIIKENLLSNMCTEENKNSTVCLMKTHAKDIFNTEYLKQFLSKYKMVDWINIYVKSMIDNSKDIDFTNIVIELLNNGIIDKIEESLIVEIFRKIPRDVISTVFEKIEKLEVFDKLFKYFTETYNKSDEIMKYSKLYLSKFRNSGEAICNVAKHISQGRSSNTMSDLIEESVKKWLLDYNFHNKENEICDVIDALFTVKRLEELFYDFLFWKKMVRCNAFINLIDSISYIVGFDKCYDLIKKNYFVAKAYDELLLADKWMQAANAIAIHYEDAKKPYILMVSNMVNEDSNLDSSSKEILLEKVLFDVLSQASNSKKRLDLEIQKSNEIKSECVQDVILQIYEPLQKLEKTIIGFSSVSTTSDDETMKVLRNMIAKIRQALKQVGILPIVDIDNWEKRKVIPFDGNLHICMEELKKGDPVTCLSMGMKDAKENFFEKATVKVYVGEKNCGNNI